MNIFDPGFSAQEAKIRYMDADFVITRPGSFVRCAITGKPIQIDDLKYWSVDTQEAYFDAETALQAYLRDRG